MVIVCHVSLETVYAVDEYHNIPCIANDFWPSDVAQISEMIEGYILQQRLVSISQQITMQLNSFRLQYIACKYILSMSIV